MNGNDTFDSQNARRGSALVASLVVVAVLAALAGAGLRFQQAVKAEAERERSAGRALQLAEAGVSDALAALATSLELDEEPPGQIGSPASPRRMRSGDYWARIVPGDEGLFAVTSTGRVQQASRTIEVVVREPEEGLFDNAIFAGNRSRDPGYALQLSGQGADADEIDGRVFSGGDVRVAGDASVSGEVAAAGNISGTTGDEGVQQKIPDVAAMHYETNHDYDVASLFAGATWTADDAGGSAWQLPASDPAHVFRKNPSDRSAENASTVKDDFYLEDPYTPVREDAGQDGSDPFLITLAGDSGTDKVFYVDGNLWVHNGPTYSFRFVNDGGEPVRVTFVVNGNITFSDNLFYGDPELDGVAFIAIEDDAVPDSGNIYFGDSAGGTLEHMDAFLYAENDFVDYHLDADGSKDVELHGIMSAGDHVAIVRDWFGPDGAISHSKLTVRFDDRISTGELELPGLPDWKETSDAYVVLAWREVTPE